MTASHVRLSDAHRLQARRSLVLCWRRRSVEVGSFLIFGLLAWVGEAVSSVAIDTWALPLSVGALVTLGASLASGIDHAMWGSSRWEHASPTRQRLRSRMVDEVLFLVLYSVSVAWLMYCTTAPPVIVLASCAVPPLVVWALGRPGKPRFEELTGPFAEKVADLARRAGVRMSSVGVRPMVLPGMGTGASVRSGGRGVEVEIDAELLEDDDAAFAAIAHELGHVVLRHPRRALMLDLVRWLAFGLAFVGLEGQLPTTLGVGSVSMLYAGLMAWLAITQLLLSATTRQAEHAADQFALTMGAEPDDIVRCLVDAPFLLAPPRPLRWTLSHPDLTSRLSALGLTVA